MSAPETGPAEDGAVLLALARALLRGRGVWPQWLGPLPQGDPGWAILLELFVALRTDSAVAVGDIAATLAIPSTTSLRYIDELQRRGHIERVPDATDRRRVFLRITAPAERAVADALGEFRALFEGALAGR